VEISFSLRGEEGPFPRNGIFFYRSMRRRAGSSRGALTIPGRDRVSLLFKKGAASKRLYLARDFTPSPFFWGQESSDELRGEERAFLSLLLSWERRSFWKIGGRLLCHAMGKNSGYLRHGLFPLHLEGVEDKERSSLKGLRDVEGGWGGDG